MKITDPPPAIAIDRVAWASQLCVGAQEVFAMMVGTKLFRCPDPQPMIVPEFTAMVGMAGAICGVFTIRCSEYAASAIAAKMLGISIEEASQEKWDAMGEVCNMVAGSFKSKLADGGQNCMLSVPTVITGADYKLRSLADEESIEVCLQFDDEPLWLSLELHK
ncbi:MAG: chemotaxis protein CheX [Candidatus Korobacteraceae bacterium]